MMAYNTPESLVFYTSAHKPTPEMGEDYVVVSKCDGYSLVFGNFCPDTGEFEGFSHWCRESYVPTDSYVLWAKLPCVVELIKEVEALGVIES